MIAQADLFAAQGAGARPRLGFIGVGWIGRHRLQALVESEVAEIAAIADPSAACLESVGELAPTAVLRRAAEELLDLSLDGVVIATPSALHPAQCQSALERGLAVFCQKPLARTAREVSDIVRLARAQDRLLGVDLSYRYTAAMRRIRQLIMSRELGEIYAVQLTFHNAYGPDKQWFYRRHLSGGGCLIDLGIHLVDLALWALGYPRVETVAAHLSCRGRQLEDDSDEVEDFAAAQLRLETGVAVQLACSWCLPAGRDAVIEARFFGTKGGGALRNVNGSFFDFVAERYHGTRVEVLVEPPDDWGGRALVRWARQLAAGGRFDPGVTRLIDVHRTLDRIYGQS